jgi:hypothetical protein
LDRKALEAITIDILALIDSKRAIAAFEAKPISAAKSTRMPKVTIEPVPQATAKLIPQDEQSDDGKLLVLGFLVEFPQAWHNCYWDVIASLLVELKTASMKSVPQIVRSEDRLAMRRFVNACSVVEQETDVNT